jgi:hypothetical protein
VVKYLGLLVVLVAACDFSEFDTLQSEMWVKSTQTPSIGSTSYAVALAPALGASASTSGGTLGVLGDGSPTFSTIIYDAKGGATTSSGNHLDTSTVALTTPPLLVADASGDVAVISVSSTATTYEITSGSGSQLSNVSFMATSPPAAATYAGTTLVIAAGSTLTVLPQGSTTPTSCTVVEAGNTTTTLTFEAVAAGGGQVFGWASNGDLVSMSMASVTTTCANGTPIAVPSLLTTTFVPGPGSTLMLMSSGASTTLVLGGLPQASSSTDGFVMFVPLASPTGAQGTSVQGLAAAALGPLGAGGDTYLALGLPSVTVDGVAAGAVDLYKVDTTTTTLPTTADETLFCARPTTGQVFGRSLAILPYNGTNILSVAANNEVFTYFRTQQYADTRQQ